MSMHQYMPDQAVLADFCTLFCPECSQKMRLIMATPALDGKATRTYECAYGHRERIIAPLPSRALGAVLTIAGLNRSARLHYLGNYMHAGMLGGRGNDGAPMTK